MSDVFKNSAAEMEVQAFYESILDQWPQPSDQRWISTRWGHTFAIESGNPAGPALVLLHGTNFNSSVWRRLASELGAQFRIYTIDIPGEPGKSAKNRMSFYEHGYAQWLSIVLDRLHIRHAILMGVSRGAWVALRFATSQPHKVTSLVLVSPSGIVKTRLSYAIASRILSVLGRWGARRATSILIGTGSVSPWIQEFAELVFANCKPRLEQEYIFSEKELRRLFMPVLLLGCSHDGSTNNEAVASRMGKYLPDLVIERADASGCYPTMLSGRVLAFMKAKFGV